MATVAEPTALMEEISVHPPKRLLYGPGPGQVHPRVYQAMAQPIVGHLDAYFFQISSEIQRLLRTVFGTKNEMTFVISATGSGGMETAISNFVQQGTKVAVFANGFFCDRQTEMARRQGGEVVRFEKPWGEVFGDKEAAEFIHREKPQVVTYVQAETSSGAYQRGEAICKAAHEVGALVIADCVTSLGAMPVEVDKTGIDIAYSCSQKGLSCPPGLSPITVSPRAMEWLKARDHAQSLLVLRHQADRRLPGRVAPLSSHRLGDHVLRAARRSCADRGRRPREPLGAPSPGASGIREADRRPGTRDARRARRIASGT